MVTKKKQLAVHRLAEHFGELALEHMVVFRHDFPPWMRVDVYAEISRHFAQREGHQFSGCRIRGRGIDFRFPNLLEKGERAIALAPPVHTMIDLGDGEMAQTLLRGLWLDEQDGIRYVLLLESNDNPWEKEFRVEIAVPPGDQPERHAKALLDHLIKAGDQANTHRGRILTPGPGPSNYEPAALDFQRLPWTPVSRDEVILDRRTFELFDMNTLGFVAQADAMSKLGFSGRKGVLLYGPPGTGKTLLIRYLVSQLEGYTRFILTPESFGFFGEIMEAARKMLPALIVIEDADLIAEDRNECAPGASGLLNQLLNEMDGLTSDAPILFVLTTNRPEVLEPALASRPGRIDQAIEVGLPQDRERRLMLARFAKSVGLSEEIIVRVSKETGDVSPAFLKELVRRAAQGMLKASETNLEMRHFEHAMTDMVQGGGKIGAQLIGATGMGFL